VIQNNAKNGVIVQQYDLALREVNRSQAGNYTCVASNVEGDGYSNIVELKIMCKYSLLLILYMQYEISVHSKNTDKNARRRDPLQRLHEKGISF